MQIALESLSWAGLTSVDSILSAEGASIFLDHAHLFSTEASVFDRHSKERVFVLLVVGGEGVLVEQHQFCVIRARFRKLWKFLSDGSDQAGFPLHAFVVGHADFESEGIPQVASSSRCRSQTEHDGLAHFASVWNPSHFHAYFCFVAYSGSVTCSTHHCDARLHLQVGCRQSYGARQLCRD